MPEKLEQSLIDRLLSEARRARENAYAPYSGFQVGAALYVPELDVVGGGANVENASYGATICAERAALVSLVAKHGKKTIGAVLVFTDAAEPAVPCALCLQVLAEFCLPSVPVLLANFSGVQARYSFSDLLPHPFTNFEVK